MTDLTLLPAELAELSVAQLAALSPQQKIVLARQLEQAGDWLKQVKARLDAALEQTYGDRIRVARSDGGRHQRHLHGNAPRSGQGAQRWPECVAARQDARLA